MFQSSEGGYRSGASRVRFNLTPQTSLGRVDSLPIVQSDQCTLPCHIPESSVKNPPDSEIPLVSFTTTQSRATRALNVNTFPY